MRFVLYIGIKRESENNFVMGDSASDFSCTLGPTAANTSMLNK